MGAENPTILPLTEQERTRSLRLRDIFYPKGISVYEATPLTFESYWGQQEQSIRVQNESIQLEWESFCAAAQGPLERGGFTRVEWDTVDPGILNRIVRRFVGGIEVPAGRYRQPQEDKLNQTADSTFDTQKTAETIRHWRVRGENISFLSPDDESIPDLSSIFPVDGRYLYGSLEHVRKAMEYARSEFRNIFDFVGRKPGNTYLEEGILWDRRYAQDTEMLEYFRIYHQFHRDYFSAHTVDVPQLMEYMKEFITQGPQLKKSPEHPDVMSKEEYLSLIVSFNQDHPENPIRFGTEPYGYYENEKYVPITDIDTDLPYILFPVDPETVRSQLIALLPKGVKTFMGSNDVIMVEWGNHTTESATRTIFRPIIFVEEDSKEEEIPEAGVSTIEYVSRENVDMIAKLITK